AECTYIHLLLRIIEPSDEIFGVTKKLDRPRSPRPAPKSRERKSAVTGQAYFCVLARRFRSPSGAEFRGVHSALSPYPQGPKHKNRLTRPKRARERPLHRCNSQQFNSLASHPLMVGVSVTTIVVTLHCTTSGNKKTLDLVMCPSRRSGKLLSACEPTGAR